jgi:hypothetical protein
LAVLWTNRRSHPRRECARGPGTPINYPTPIERRVVALCVAATAVGLAGFALVANSTHIASFGQGALTRAATAADRLSQSEKTGGGVMSEDRAGRVDYAGPSGGLPCACERRAFAVRNGTQSLRKSTTICRRASASYESYGCSAALANWPSWLRSYAIVSIDAASSTSAVTATT